jgi:hypothetical protein
MFATKRGWPPSTEPIKDERVVAVRRANMARAIHLSFITMPPAEPWRCVIFDLSKALSV